MTVLVVAAIAFLLGLVGGAFFVLLGIVVFASESTMANLLSIRRGYHSPR